LRERIEDRENGKEKTGKGSSIYPILFPIFSFLFTGAKRFHPPASPEHKRLNFAYPPASQTCPLAKSSRGRRARALRAGLVKASAMAGRQIFNLQSSIFNLQSSIFNRQSSIYRGVNYERFKIRYQKGR